MIRYFIASLFGALVIIIVAALWLMAAEPVQAGECRQIKVSWYGGHHHGRKTASGSTFNENAMTAAMMSRAHFGEKWRVTYGKRSVVVTVTDTGNFAKYGRGMDLSRGAFSKLASTAKGVIPVKACRAG